MCVCEKEPNRDRPRGAKIIGGDVCSGGDRGEAMAATGEEEQWWQRRFARRWLGLSYSEGEGGGRCFALITKRNF